jgi:uncharacterized protein GlcG (DUF336 family)
MHNRTRLAVPLVVWLLLGPVLAEDLVDSRLIGLDLARDIAQASIDSCRKQGYQVSAVVVDRSATTVVVMRDTLAPRFTIQLARDKANAVILGGTESATLRVSRADIRAELNLLDDVLVLEGGLPIRAAGSLVGAIGVSGAPGGDRDAECAGAALQSVQERLEFAD